MRSQARGLCHLLFLLVLLLAARSGFDAFVDRLLTVGFGFANFRFQLFQAFRCLFAIIFQLLNFEIDQLRDERFEVVAVFITPAQLYDIEAAPGETTNLYESRPEIAARLLKQLESDVTRGRSTDGPTSDNDVDDINLWKSGQ